MTPTPVRGLRDGERALADGGRTTRDVRPSEDGRPTAMGDGGGRREDRRLARTPDGRRLELSRVIDASAEAVWSVFTDTDRWPDWGPTIGAVELDDTDTTRIAAGATGRIRVAGVWFPFSITTCDDYRWTWSVARIPATGHRVDPLGPHRCRAVFELSPLAVGYAPVCRTALRRLDRLAADGVD